MGNSIIFNRILTLLAVLVNSYQNSTFHNCFTLFDIYIKNCALNSKFARILTAPNINTTHKNSFFYNISNKLLNAFKRQKLFLSKCIINSKVTYFVKSIITFTLDKPFNAISMLIIGFLTSNILFNIFALNINIKTTLIKVLILGIFVLISQINISSKKVLATSKFYTLFKWLISYKD